MAKVTSNNAIVRKAFRSFSSFEITFFKKENTKMNEYTDILPLINLVSFNYESIVATFLDLVKIANAHLR